MSIPANLLTTTCEIRRPFGAGSPTTSGIACKLATDMPRGRGSGLAGLLTWTHYIDLDDTVDIRDGCSRFLGANVVTYADGDEVRIPSGGTTRFVVVWVETRNLGTSQSFKRVYLLRDTA
ncbi:MAG: hypothetical protein K8T89_11050 [Planctomycetes bacterium]|nr:hypothetical protein [Planctomycetota bacterium]